MSLYGQDWNSKRRYRYESLMNELARIRQQRAAASRTYTEGANRINIEKPNALRKTLNRFAGKGMAYSSGYGQEVQRTNTDFAQRLAGLQANQQQAMAGADISENQANAAYQYDLSDYQAQQAAYEAQQQQELIAAQADQAEQEARIAAIMAQASAASAPAPSSGGGTAPRKKSMMSGLRRRF